MVNRPDRDRLFNEKVDRSPWLTLAILSCVGLMAMFADTMILPAIPDIRNFGITYSASSWILASFLITGAVMTPGRKVRMNLRFEVLNPSLPLSVRV